jgi:hypothetical protein
VGPTYFDNCPRNVIVKDFFPDIEQQQQKQTKWNDANGSAFTFVSQGFLLGRYKASLNS